MRDTIAKFALAATLALAGCNPSAVMPDPGPEPFVPPTAPAGTSGNEETTFDHMNELEVDPFELLDRLAEEGPADFSARLHSCPKMRYLTIGRVLSGLGVDLNGGAGSAGASWAGSDQALGAPNYEARVAESADLTTASAAKLFDIFVAAAPEIIANLPSVERCQIGGIGTSMFDDTGSCTLDGITCVMGQPAELAHVDLCNRTISSASTPEVGRIIAVAALAAAAHTCE